MLTGALDDETIDHVQGLLAGSETRRGCNTRRRMSLPPVHPMLGATPDNGPATSVPRDRSGPRGDDRLRRGGGQSG
ncbi:hypothetical protein GCM10023200_46810 [Actinomycetospora chlora]|uniref:Uncharacterized protein n=1 Tax=Actinomycetospora chlora TaxID=663608 RepID=A0ABP9C2S2_9PSEU